MSQEADKFIVGVDVGTTSVKFTAITTKYEVLLNKQIDYSYDILNDNWNEIEPEIWYHIIIKGFKEINEIYSFNDLVGIGVTGQMHTTVFLDNEGKSIRPAILWKDKRTTDIVPTIKAKLLEVQSTKSIADVVSTGSPLANLLWLKINEYEKYKKLETVFITPNYITYKLTDKKTIDYCNASTSSLYDFKKNTWSKEVIEMFQLDPKLFPPIEYASSIAGELTNELKDKFQIKHSVPVIVGTGDNVASVFSNNGFNHCQPIISLGTSGMLVIPNNKEEYKSVGKNVKAGIYPDDNFIITQGSIQAGAKVNEWWVKNILNLDDYEKEQEQVHLSLLGNNKVIFSPHMSGEKTLFSNPELKSGFYGLDLTTTKSEIYLSILEGVAFGIKMLFENMRNEERPEYMIILGGGSKSDLWVKVFANILNSPMYRTDKSSEAVHGIAKLALESLFSGSNENNKIIYEITNPNPVIADKYREKYKSYISFIEKTRQLSQEYSE